MSEKNRVFNVFCKFYVAEWALVGAMPQHPVQGDIAFPLRIPTLPPLVFQGKSVAGVAFAVVSLRTRVGFFFFSTLKGVELCLAVCYTTVREYAVLITSVGIIPGTAS